MRRWVLLWLFLGTISPFGCARDAPNACLQSLVEEASKACEGSPSKKCKALRRRVIQGEKLWDAMTDLERDRALQGCS